MLHRINDRCGGSAFCEEPMPRATLFPLCPGLRTPQDLRTSHDRGALTAASDLHSSLMSGATPWKTLPVPGRRTRGPAGLRKSCRAGSGSEDDRVLFHSHCREVRLKRPTAMLSNNQLRIRGVDLKGAGAHLGVSTRTLRRWVDAGRVPFRRVGRTLRFPLAALNPR